MKICIICPEYPPGPIGGVGTYTQSAARWLVKAGHEVKIIGTYDIDYPAAEFETDQGVEVYRIKHKPGKFTWVGAWYRQYRMIKKWIDNNEVDIVEAPDGRGWYAGWGETKVPLIIRAHGTETSFAAELGGKAKWLTTFLEAKSYERADEYCAVSLSVARMNEKAFNLPQKHTVIYNALPWNEGMSVGADQTREERLVVYSGSLIEKKGIYSLIKASLMLHARNVAHQVVINGKDYMDPVKGSVRKIVDEMIPAGLKANYTFNGHVDRPTLYSYYRRAAVAVFPSFVEAFALAPMEAMISACPTIYTKRVSGPELIEDGKEGILVDPADIEQIANSIAWCINNPELAKKMGEAGREKIFKKFNLEDLMQQNVAFYENAIRKFKSKSSFKNQ